jgi:hypothetical protein
MEVESGMLCSGMLCIYYQDAVYHANQETFLCDRQETSLSNHTMLYACQQPKLTQDPPLTRHVFYLEASFAPVN